MYHPSSEGFCFFPRFLSLHGCHADLQTPQDQLQKLMEARGFTKLSQQKLPLVIREHQRKYQYIVTCWKLYVQIEREVTCGDTNMQPIAWQFSCVLETKFNIF